MDVTPTKIQWKKTPFLYLAIPEKNKQGGWGYGISRGIKRWPRKNYVEFPRVLVFGIGISKGCNPILHNFHWGGILICLEFPGVK